MRTLRRSHGTSELNNISTECILCHGEGRFEAEGQGLIDPCIECEGNKLSPFYYNAIKNVDVLDSRNNRVFALKDFARYLGLTNVEGLANFYKVNGVPDYELFERKIGDGYITTELKGRRKLNYSSQKHMISEIKRSYELNREKGIPWELIDQEYIRQPSGVKKPKFHPYEYNEVKTLYDNSILKYKAAISLLLIIRVGGIYQRITKTDRLKYPERVHYLKIKDLRPAMEGWTYEQKRDFALAVPDYSDVYKMIIYADAVNSRTGESEEYVTWTTPEGFALINLMLEKRQMAGELGEELRNKPFKLSNFPPDAPVFRDRYGIIVTHGIRIEGNIKAHAREKTRLRNLLIPEALDENAIRSYLSVIRIKHLGHIPKKGARAGTVKTGKKIVHALRSSGASWMDESKVHDSANEWLQGADLKGRREHYREWPDWKILVEFWKAVPALTIDKTKYLQETIQQKDKVIEEKEIQIRERRRDQYLWDLKHEEMEKRMDKFESGLEILLRRMGETPPERTLIDKEAPALSSDEKLEKRLDRMEAMISKVLPTDEQPRGEVKKITSQALEDKSKHEDNGGAINQE